jgi:uncharacterized protein (DUF1697 family)
MAQPHDRTTRRYFALLRGINVGGHGVIKMADLRALFESLGGHDVSTYIQSGNVLFTDHGADRKRLARRLEAGVSEVIGRPVSIFLLSRRELEEAAAHNPFDPAGRADTQQCHLVFLSDEPDAEHRSALMAAQGEEYRFHVWKKVVYQAYDRSLAGHRRNLDLERILDVGGTARTWRVVDKLIELLE